MRARKIEYKILHFVSYNILIKAITFDLWNTLLEDKDFTAIRMEIMNKILLDHGVLRSHEETLQAYRSAAACYRKEWEENYRHMSVERRVKHMQQTLRINGPDEIRQQIIDGFKECFLKYPPELKEGVKDILERLIAKYRMGIISDTGVTPGNVIRKYLDERGILSHFSSTVFSDEVGYCKPHHIVFQRALKSLDVSPNEAVHVGDLLRTDVAGAKAIGMKSVWLKTKENLVPRDIEPDHTITTLSQILTLEALYE